MKITKETIKFCIDTLVVEVAQKYAEENNIDATNALRHIICTKTYEVLIAPESYLYLESAEYVFDMLISEEDGDWESWLAV
ncbi:MAG: hypothetical protein LBN36_06150 [Clostridiales Family XIII bacterium]|jgi:predicted GNAT family N-acyltransferase|nr:hypothetical protein [Clostridiales Family XIII bacterium]